MGHQIPFINGESSVTLVRDVYSDTGIVRVPMLLAKKLGDKLSHYNIRWLDTCVDGLDKIETRKMIPTKGGVAKKNPWFEFMEQFPGFERMADSHFQKKPDSNLVNEFVMRLLDESIKHKPEWITLPQLPFTNDNSRNKLNRMLADAAAKWRQQHSHVYFIYPFISTHAKQIASKTDRNPRVEHAHKCIVDAQATGVWVADQSLEDEKGSTSLRAKRFSAVLNLHEEINDKTKLAVRIGGPYWGLNLVLWSRGLIDFPAIGVGSAYNLSLSGGHITGSTNNRIAISALRRRVIAGSSLKLWLKQSLDKMSTSHAAHAEFSELYEQHSLYRDSKEFARKQVATAYKQWIDKLGSVPSVGRSMALFQDLSAAYALGKSLGDIAEEDTVRRPESVAESLMLICL